MTKNPLKEYRELIQSRLENPLPKGVRGERHHIVPKCVGGPENAEWNIVKLTLEEHYKAHSLLPLIYTEGRAHTALVFAWNMVRTRITGVDTESEEYAVLNRETVIRRRVRMRGNG